MVLPNFLVMGLAGFSGGLLIGLLGFAKNRLNNAKGKKKWNWEKFLWTLLSYGIPGFIVGLWSENVFLALVSGLAVDTLVKLVPKNGKQKV